MESVCVCGLNSLRSADVLRLCNLSSEDILYRPLSDFEDEVSGVGARDKALMRWEAAEARRAESEAICQKKYDEIMGQDPSWKDRTRDDDGDLPPSKPKSNETPMRGTTAIKKLQAKHARVAQHNKMISTAVGQRHFRESFVREIVTEQHAAWNPQPHSSTKNPAEGKGYAEAGPPAPRQGELTKPEEHRKRRDGWIEDEKQYTQELKLRDDFRSHTEVVDQEERRKRNEDRKALADKHAARKRKKIKEINAIKERRLAESAKQTVDTFKQKHELSTVHRSEVHREQREEQMQRSLRREVQAEAALKSREEQAVAEALQRQELLRQQALEEKRARQLRKERKRELKAFRAKQRAKERSIQERLREVHEDHASWQMEKMNVLAEQSDRVEVMREYKKYQIELVKERTQLRHEDKKWRRTHLQLAIEDAREDVRKTNEHKDMRSKMLEESMVELQSSIGDEQRRRLIKRDDADEELRLRRITGDWTRSKEQLFYPSRCMSVPLPRCAGNSEMFSNTAVLPTPSALTHFPPGASGFKPPRSAGGSSNTAREQTPDQFAAALISQAGDDRAISRTPMSMSRSGTPILLSIHEGGEYEAPTKLSWNSSPEVKVRVQGGAHMQNLSFDVEQNLVADEQVGTAGPYHNGQVEPLREKPLTEPTAPTITEAPSESAVPAIAEAPSKRAAPAMEEAPNESAPATEQAPNEPAALTIEEAPTDPAA